MLGVLLALTVAASEPMPERLRAAEAVRHPPAELTRGEQRACPICGAMAVGLDRLRDTASLAERACRKPVPARPVATSDRAVRLYGMFVFVVGLLLAQALLAPYLLRRRPR